MAPSTSWAEADIYNLILMRFQGASERSAKHILKPPNLVATHSREDILDSSVASILTDLHAALMRNL